MQNTKRWCTLLPLAKRQQQGSVHVDRQDISQKGTSYLFESYLKGCFSRKIQMLFMLKICLEAVFFFQGISEL